MSATQDRKAKGILTGLPLDTQRELWEEIQQCRTLEDARERLASLGYAVKSRTTVSEFWRFWQSRERLLAAEQVRAQVIAHSLATMPDIPLERVEQYADTIFLAAAAERQDVKAYRAARTFTEASKRGKRDERKLALLEKKAAAADAVAESLEAKRKQGGLSAEALELIENALGMLKA